MRDYFAMMMLVEIDGMSVDFSTFAESMRGKGETLGVDIRVMHEDIFNSMHKI
jgi:ACT domain-containing protein